jgi:hypothetical protein
MLVVRSLAVAALFSVIALPLAGCSSRDASEEEDGAGDPTAQALAAPSCGQAKYDEAFKHYRKATYGAKARLAGNICGDEDTAGDGTTYSTYMSFIEDEAATAIMTCDAFKNVIKTSPYAEPIRKVLADQLVLKSLTGELLVLRNSQFQNWTNVEAYLPGTELYSNAFGIYWSQEEIQFKANGQANYVTWVEDKETGLRAVNTPATYRVEKTGSDRDPRRIILKRGNQTETFQLRVRDTEPGNFETAPVFELQHSDWNKGFSSVRDECSA